jgi:hypothetical protein
MQEEVYHTMQTLLSTTNRADIERGLALARAAAPEAEAGDCAQLCDMVLPLFYIDTLDHPEYAEVVQEAINLISSLGEPVIPVLIQNMETGDVKAQMAIAQALGGMGARAIDPLMAEYESTCPDPSCRAFLLYALGKVKAPEIVKAAALAAEAAGAADLELRDTATRALGKFAESIPPGGLPADVRAAFLAQLERNLADPSPAISAKAVRSLGKLAKYGHLTASERAELKTRLQRLLGEDAGYEWHRAYVVRKEAREALDYV